MLNAEGRIVSLVHGGASIMRNWGLIGIGAGMLLTVASIFGLFGSGSLGGAGVGVLIILVSAGLLLFTQSLTELRFPHPAIWLLFALAVGLHGYENLYESSGGFSLGWFVWSLSPHLLALFLSCFRATRFSAVAGAAVALLIDFWVFHAVFIDPTSSTAALAMIWFPLWNILIFVPAATWIAWVIQRRRAAIQRAS